MLCFSYCIDTHAKFTETETEAIDIASIYIRLSIHPLQFYWNSFDYNTRIMQTLLALLAAFVLG